MKAKYKVGPPFYYTVHFWMKGMNKWFPISEAALDFGTAQRIVNDFIRMTVGAAPGIAYTKIEIHQAK